MMPDPAERVVLGRSGLAVTRLGLGLASLGGMFAPVTEVDARATIDAAWRAGVRLFDTAPVYGYGRSEVRAGRALVERPREEFVLCTKVGRLIEPGGPDTQSIWADPPPGLGPRLDYSVPGVVASVEASLERLGLDRIDVVHIHDPDLRFAEASTEAVRALLELRASGVIGALSIGVNDAETAVRFLRVTGDSGIDCVLLAGRYTVLDRSGATELLPLCRQLGVVVLAAGVFGGGVLADPVDGGRHGFARIPQALAARIAVVRAACDRHGVSPLAAAAQFPLTDPSVAAVIVGARSAAEIEQTAAMFAHPVPPELWNELTAI